MITNDAAPQVPALLWIGQYEALHQRALAWLQKIVGTCQGCNLCTGCIQIHEKQHPSITWITPTRSYTLENLEPLKHTLSFVLDEGAQHWFVIEQAQLLTTPCANSLLKALEEPPTGYHFLLLASRADSILPTIISRCIVQTWYEQTIAPQEALFTFFTAECPPNPSLFLQELERRKPSEIETVKLLDQLLMYWLAKAQHATVHHQSKEKKVALAHSATLKLYLATPLMPGSSKLIWKDLFLQYTYHSKS